LAAKTTESASSHKLERDSRIHAALSWMDSTRNVLFGYDRVARHQLKGLTETQLNKVLPNRPRVNQELRGLIGA
jgi:hypothetical protein